MHSDAFVHLVAHHQESLFEYRSLQKRTVVVCANMQFPPRIAGHINIGNLDLHIRLDQKDAEYMWMNVGTFTAADIAPRL